ncbi:MAG: hypothetical protein M1281_00480 [Chloroflexi bacterium]|nr:hypothetical protein [Chloroflexota bacterium]
MPRKLRFMFVCDPDERRLIRDLANTLHRSESDVVRLIVVGVAREMWVKGLLRTAKADGSAPGQVVDDEG